MYKFGWVPTLAASYFLHGNWHFFANIGHIFAITDTYATLQPLHLPAPKPVFRHINSPWWHFFTFLVMCNFYACFIHRICWETGVLALIFHVVCIIQGWWLLNDLPKLANIGPIFAITDTYATLQPLHLPAPKPIFRHINSPWWHFFIFLVMCKSIVLDDTFLFFWSCATSTHVLYIRHATTTASTSTKTGI